MGEVGTQHTNMFVYGEKGSTFSVEAMRRQAALRLKEGWSTTIHHHTHEEDCKAQPDSNCEFYASPEEA